MSAATQLISRRHLLMVQKLTYLRQNLNHRQDFTVSLGRRLGLSTVSFRGLEPSLKNESYCEMTCIFYIRDSTQKDFPEDPSGRFDDFDHFVKSSFDTCKWIGWLLVLAQGCSVLLATVLRATEKDQGRKYDNEDDYAPQRLPFLGYPVQPFPCVVVDLPLALQQ